MSVIRSKVSRLKTRFPLYARVLEGGAWKVGGTGVVTLLSVAINGLLTRLLTPNDMGYYVFALSLITTISLVAKAGLGSIVIREVSGALGNNDLEKAREVLQWIFKWGIISIVSVSLIFGLLGEKIGIPHYLVLLAVGWLIILAGQQLLVDTIRGFQNTKIAAVLHGGRIGGPIAAAISVVCFFAVWRTTGNIQVKTAISVLVVAGGIALIIAGIIVNRNVKDVLGKIKFNIHLPPLQILGMALPVLMHDLASTLLTQSSIWIVKYFRSVSEVAIYGTAQQLAAFLSIQQSIIIFVLSPEIAALHAQGELRKLEKLQRRVATLASVPILVAFLVLLIGGEEILTLLYGDFYSVGKPVVILLATGYIGHVLAGSCGLTLVMTGHQIELMRISLISSLLTLVIAFGVAGPFGLRGIAGATAFGYIVKNIWMLFVVKKRVGIWTCATLKWN